jgi:hypothetical protein
MKTTVRFLRHAGVYRPMCDLFESLTRSAAFRSGPGQTFRTHRKLLRPTHRRDEPRPAIPQRVARQHCPSLLHRHAHPKSVPGSGTINLQRTVNSVLTVCLTPGDNPNSKLNEAGLCSDEPVSDSGRCDQNSAQPNFRAPDACHGRCPDGFLGPMQDSDSCI